MKKTLKKLLAVLAVVALVLPTVGCDKKTTDDGEVVTLKWVIMGPGKQKDADMVWEKFNELLPNYLPGVQVEFEVMTGGEYSERWQLMMSAREEVDLVWTGYATSVPDEVNKGAYLPLDDLLEEYGQDMKAELEDWVFDLGRFNGELYTIPCYQTMSSSPIGLRFIKEQADKYLDVEKLNETYLAWETDPAKGEEFYAMLGDYFQALKDNGELKNGVGNIGDFPYTQKIDETTIHNFKIDTNTMKVFYDPLSEDTKLWFKTAAEWYKKGYFRSDILSAPDFGLDEYKNGYIIWQHVEYNENKAAQESKQLGVDIEIVPIGKDWIIKNAVPATATSIASTSKHPELAMQLMNLINSKKGAELYNLLTFGLEGVHYEKIGENRIKPFDYATQGEEGSAYGLWKWALGNTLNAWEVESDIVGLAEYVKSLDDKALVLPTLGFKPSSAEVSTELAQLGAVVDEYGDTLGYGVAGDGWEAVYEEFKQKLEKAGVNKVVEHLQAQLDEYIASK